MERVRMVVWTEAPAENCVLLLYKGQRIIQEQKSQPQPDGRVQHTAIVMDANMPVRVVRTFAVLPEFGAMTELVPLEVDQPGVFAD